MLVCHTERPAVQCYDTVEGRSDQANWGLRLQWVLAMEIYDRVAKIVAPKKERMQLAEAEQQKTLEHLNKKRTELKTIEERTHSVE